MPEYLRALIAILVLSLPVFWIVREPLCAVAILETDFKRRRNLWIGITVLAFLGHSFWVYAVAAGLALSVAGGRDSNRFGLYLSLLFVIPPFSAQIRGVGGINYFIEIDHLRLLSLTVLLPAYMRLRGDTETVSFGRAWADRWLLAYLLLQLGLQAAVDTATNTMRSGFYAFSDVFLPYYVASRSLRNMEVCRDALASFVFAVLMMAPVAAFEYAKHWLLYASLPGALGVRFGMGNYLGRGDSLRALASTGHSIVLGYAMLVALSFYAFVRRSIDRRGAALAMLAALVIGLITPISRGPWVGAAAALAVLMLTGPNKLSRLGRFIVIALPTLAVLLITPFGDKIINLLPFVGTVDDSTVSYRERLFEVSMSVLMYNPFFGSFQFWSAPQMQQLIQGEGIIDMVNSYLAVAMTFGLVGLSMFCAVFAAAAWGVVRGMGAAEPGSELHDLGRALLAAMVGALVTIATVSSILTVPTVYWLIAGLSVGYANLARRRQDEDVRSPAALFNRGTA
jgi:O-antigen ligase